MMELNKVILIGRAGRDPSIKDCKNGSKLVNFSLATNKRWLSKETKEWESVTSWHNITCFGYAAEQAEKYVKKGVCVYVEGSLEYRKYTNKENVEVNQTSIVATKVGSLEKKIADIKQAAPDELSIEGDVPPEIVKEFEDEIPF